MPILCYTQAPIFLFDGRPGARKGPPHHVTVAHSEPRGRRLALISKERAAIEAEDVAPRLLSAEGLVEWVFFSEGQAARMEGT